MSAEGPFRASWRKLCDANRLLLAQPRVVVLFSVVGLGLVVLAADAVGLRQMAASVGLSALFSILVAFPTYLVSAAAGTGLAWHAERTRTGMPTRPAPLRVMLRGARDNAASLALWAVVAGVVNGVAALRIGNPAVDTVIEVAAMFWQMVASSVVAYVVVFRHGLVAAVVRGVERTRRTWKERLVRMALVNVATVAALVLAAAMFVVSAEYEPEDLTTATVLALVAVVVVVTAVAWSSALRFAVNIVGRVDERRRSDGPALSAARRPDSPPDA